MRQAFRVAGLGFFALVTAACASDTRRAADVADGRQVFFTQCHGCHTLGVASYLSELR